MLFCRLGSQWRLLTGLNGLVYQGLDYTGVLAALRLQGIPRRDWPDLFWRLQVLEAAARQELNSMIQQHGQ